MRAEQAEETRARILDATLRVIAGGVASLSIPAVAREAGVSVPTVYRHFGTKGDLFAALHPHVGRRVGIDQVADPTTLEGHRDFIRAMFERLDSFDDLARAAIASPVADEARRATMPKRLERIRKFVDSAEPGLRKTDRDRIARLMAVIASSSALRVWRNQLGSSVDEAADDVDWILRAALSAAKRRNER